LLFNNFFSVCRYMPLLRRYIPTKLCNGAQMAIFIDFVRPVFPASRVQHVSDLHPKFALMPHHVCKYGRHPRCGPSANLECRSEMCCTRLAASAGPKKVAKNRHLGTIPQLCWAIFRKCCNKCVTLWCNRYSSGLSFTLSYIVVAV